MNQMNKDNNDIKGNDKAGELVYEKDNQLIIRYQEKLYKVAQL